MKKAKKSKKEPDVIIQCHRCGEKYIFDDFDMLNEIDVSTPCRKCGFLLFRYSLEKLDATAKLVLTDPKARELLEQDSFEDFNKYFKEKTGFS